ncbi:hypothetical protein RM190_04555 [Paracoccus sp. CPCC 101403]|uniref:Uncharacterized protein n=2 Tax=Paracoccus broussonetiae TaxID=3075834 RepID=A0ABU3EA74_9RHOB|nr:hypothetical protein [Paracoccus sp. CPCC 101403]MDT1061119.1 hypothetical protein [Paracoccus sp. CPCC 101403]
MARIGAPPETHYTLPADFAATLGHCVATFGWLEEIIKRTIYALDKARLADDLTERELHAWLSRMSSLADDSMGTLIEQLDAAMRRHPGLPDRDRLTQHLNEIKRQRNLLCHASWRPTDDPARWHPAFVNMKGEIFDHALTVAELEAIGRTTVEIGNRVLGVMRATGIQGHWSGDDDG